MNEEEEEYVKQSIKKAFEELIKNDFYLLLVNINERTLTHRLAIYLEKYFPQYHVDCEYNRNGIGTRPKELHNLSKKIYSAAKKKTGTKKIVEDIDAMTVFPDIIIHKRGIPAGFVVIEAKKSNNNTGYDKEKLELYKKELGYKYAFFVIFPIPSTDFQDTNFDELDYENLVKLT